MESLSREFQHPPPKPTSVVVDTRSGERGSLESWVEAFAHVWKAPRERLDRLMGLLSTDVVLRAPTYPPVSRGQIDGRAAFDRIFRALPDLHARVQRWSTSGDALFIEFRSEATIGGRPVCWTGVDRFVFRDGQAVERVNYFDPSPVRRAFLHGPGALWQLLRLRFNF